MKKITGWLIVATTLLILGMIIFGGTMMSINWDFSKLSTTGFVTNEYEGTENFKDILVDSNLANVVLIPSENEKYIVTCFEQEKMLHTVSVKDNALTIKLQDTRKWYEHIGVNFNTPEITVAVPVGEYEKLLIDLVTGNVEIAKDFSFESINISSTTGNITNCASSVGEVKLSATTGEIKLQEVSAGKLDINCTSGKVTLTKVDCEGDVKLKITTGRTDISDLKCKNLESNGGTGDICLKNTVAEEAFFIKRTTGGICFEKCDAASITAKASTGDIKGSLLSEKVFIAQSSTGKVNVPASSSGGKCELTTSTGNIEITVEQRGE